ncbi:mechanosensitive ion channel protein 10-like [Cucurbita pepo subsp. pepo]|uniref:mechanosensitive ion channel protein 10-like n=1 Tax=Cucurbita pepo subsp. pepo TaxID=3664 RepID=UPI000C9D7C4A|nr:mechanosensitive ion channel protein 10-like [Cucurbita pepo subsp. pepo]XP_023524087.1 mechanosensitive ion channel protein 10-like [Cucurbita pepo subsp. pepo]
MDVNGNKPLKPIRRSSSQKESENGSQVVVEISRDENGYSVPKQNRVDSQTKEPTDSSIGYGYDSHLTPTANKPPKIPGSVGTLTPRKSLKRSILSKPKSRFGEQSSFIDSDTFEENRLSLRDQISANSSRRSTLNTPKEHHEEGDDDIFKIEKFKKEKHKKVKVITLIKWVGAFCIIGCLVASLTIKRLKKYFLWGIEIWKWCLLATVILCGMIFTHRVMNVIVFLIERNFLLQKKVFYFVHGLKKSVQVTLWLTLVLVTWVSLFDRSSHRVLRSKISGKILDAITWTLITLLIGAFLWLIKTLLLKILASKFHMNRFFDRIQESIFHHHVLQTLLNPSPIGMPESTVESNSGRLSFKGKKSDHKKVIDLGKIHQLKREKVSAWTMKVLVDAVASSEMSISQLLDESYQVADGEITDETEVAGYAAFKIFNNIALPGNDFIEEEDLRRVMIKEEVDLVLPLFEVDETRRIDWKSLTNWVLKVYKERKTLAHALKDTKTAVKQLNNLVTVLLIIVTAIIWLLLMEIATTKVLVFLLSQLAVAVFMFGNTCKTIFEALVFVFVMHPFDVGDRCAVEGVPLMVEEMNILTTVFLKLNNEKVYYPNSVLATKSITNYYRSPDMSDTVEFSIGFATPLERIGLMKDRIRRYLEKNPQHWHPNHSVVVKEIEDVNKIKFALYSNHTMNFQDWTEKNRRRTELVMELKRIFEELKINYNLLPQTVHLFPAEGH